MQFALSQNDDHLKVIQDKVMQVVIDKPMYIIILYIPFDSHTGVHWCGIDHNFVPWCAV